MKSSLSQDYPGMVNFVRRVGSATFCVADGATNYIFSANYYKRCAKDFETLQQ